MPQIYRIKLLKGNQCSKDLYNHNKVPAMKSHCRQTMLTPPRSIYHKTKCIGNCIFRLKGETCIPYWKWIEGFGALLRNCDRLENNGVN